jgi:hypothetical protein
MRNLKIALHHRASFPALMMSSDAAPAEGAGGAAPAPAAPAAAGADTPFYETFTDAALKTSPSIQRYKSVEDLAKSHVNLEARFGIDPARRIDLPADPNDAEGMRAVYARLGLPEKPEDYGLKVAETASDAEKQMMGKAAAEFHKLGLPAAMAQGVTQWWLGQQAEAQQAAEAADTARISEGRTGLEKEFGAAFDARVKEVRGLVEKYFGDELAGAMKDDALYRYPNLVTGLAKIVERMAEPGVAGGGSGDAARPGAPLTPAQAQGAVNALQADAVKAKALFDPAHPQHKAVVAERNRLLALADGREPA